MGILDFMGDGEADPRTQAARAMAQSLLGRGGGLQRLAGGLGNYGSVLEVLKNQELRRALVQSQISETEAQAEQRKQLAAAAQQKQAEALRAQAEQEAFFRKYSSVRGADANAVSGITGPRPEAAAMIGQRPKIDPLEAIRLFGPENAQKVIESSKWGAPKIGRTVEVNIGGKPFTQQLDENGNAVGPPMPKWVAPHFQSLGNVVQAIDPTSVTPNQTFKIGMSPSDQVSIRGQDLVNARAREKLAQDQSLLTNELGDPAQAALVKMFGKPEPGRRWKPDGSLEPIPGGSQDAKSQLKLAGEGTVNGVVAELRDRFNSLKKSGGVTSTDNGSLGNVAAWLSSSGAGQATGRMLGTQSQSDRNAILQARPMLLQAIMKATGMSAKQMDSNAELKLYLSTATDPTLDYEANIAALDRIEAMFGGGGVSSQGKSKTVNFADLK